MPGCGNLLCPDCDGFDNEGDLLDKVDCMLLSSNFLCFGGLGNKGDLLDEVDSSLDEYKGELSRKTGGPYEVDSPSSSLLP